MILRAGVRVNLDPTTITRTCTIAERETALAVERDTRQYIPSKRIAASGRVYGNIILWTGENVRLFYFGFVKVDPETGYAGFKTKDGWRSRPGVKKVRSDRKFHFKTGTDMWFIKSRNDNLERWLNVARGYFRGAK